jgi:hypothetical protein
MYTVKYREGNRFIVEHYPVAEWRDHRASRLITRGVVVTLSKVK